MGTALKIVRKDFRRRLKSPFSLILFVSFPLILSLFRRRLARRGVVVAYLHPYDVDHEQERFMHPGLDDSRLFNSLMFWNRKRVLQRLERLFDQGAAVIPFAEYLASELSQD